MTEAFQAFTVTARPDQGPPRIAALRRAMAEAGLAGIVVPRADAYQGEYVAPRDERLAWLTGFTGSAGFACVTSDRAALFVDGRYRVQARAQVATDVIEPVAWPDTGLAAWLREALPDGGRVGYDPWLHTVREIEALARALEGSGVDLVPVESPVDRLWRDRPAADVRPAVPYPEALAGASAADKRARIADLVQAAGADAAVLTQPDSVAWLLNIRGGDIAHTPVVHARALIRADGSLDLFAVPEKFANVDLGADVRLHIAPAVEGALRQMTGRVLIDPRTAPAAVLTALDDGPAEVVRGDDPCLIPKATKTEAEIAATREAHLRDGAAMVRFLHWFQTATADGGTVTEIDCVRALEGFRRQTGHLRDISFDTIAGAGPNGAIVHYRVTEGTNRTLGDGDLFLIDSGGQYEDGTTDVTRTLAVGQPDNAQRTAFTQVLRGLIAMARLRFPEGLAGRDIDAVARAPLWSAGRNYDHGTGHGVGVYLSVHEDPQRISKTSEVPLQPGMILSNEPGYYREGAWGIRIENLQVVVRADPVPGGDDRPMLAFETLTFVPIDRRLMDLDQLTRDDRAWIDAYHDAVRMRLSDRLDGPAAAWLDRACAPL